MRAHSIVTRGRKGSSDRVGRSVAVIGGRSGDAGGSTRARSRRAAPAAPSPCGEAPDAASSVDAGYGRSARRSSGASCAGRSRRCRARCRPTASTTGRRRGRTGADDTESSAARRVAVAWGQRPRHGVLRWWFLSEDSTDRRARRIHREVGNDEHRSRTLCSVVTGGQRPAGAAGDATSGVAHLTAPRSIPSGVTHGERPRTRDPGRCASPGTDRDPSSPTGPRSPQQRPGRSAFDVCSPAWTFTARSPPPVRSATSPPSPWTTPRSPGCSTSPASRPVAATARAGGSSWCRTRRSAAGSGTPTSTAGTSTSRSAPPASRRGRPATTAPSRRTRSAVPTRSPPPRARTASPSGSTRCPCSSRSLVDLGATRRRRPRPRPLHLRRGRVGVPVRVEPAAGRARRGTGRRHHHDGDPRRVRGARRAGRAPRATRWPRCSRSGHPTRTFTKLTRAPVSSFTTVDRVDGEAFG